MGSSQTINLIASYLREFEEMMQEVGAHFGPYYNVLSTNSERQGKEAHDAKSQVHRSRSMRI